jgi:hypothetical protein
MHELGVGASAPDRAWLGVHGLRMSEIWSVRFDFEPAKADGRRARRAPDPLVREPDANATEVLAEELRA